MKYLLILTALAAAFGLTSCETTSTAPTPAKSNCAGGT